MFDFAEQHQGSAVGDSVMELVVVRNGQRVFADVISEYLRRIQYAEDGNPELIRVPAYAGAQVVVDPHRSFGSPLSSEAERASTTCWNGSGLATRSTS